MSSHRNAAGVLDAPVPCDGRVVDLPVADYDWIRVLVDADRTGAETVWLYYENAVEPEYLHVTVIGTAHARIAVPRRERLVGLRLPECSGTEVLSLEPIPSTRPMERGGA
ncbi:hypothetical protein ACWFMI_06185 [Nocardiopsis terrae]